jgi:hypothetical protein
MYSKKQEPRLPIWMLLVGLLGIVNFIVGCWVLFPPDEGSAVFFWPVQFYNYALLPSLFLFPISLICITLWLISLTDRWWVHVIVSLAGATLTVLCFIPAFGMLFLSTFRVIGEVKQNDHVYYLVSYIDDRAPYFEFCKADAIGFSGQCRLIGAGSNGDPPKIYIDQITKLVTIESINPSFIWINSDPPRCINNLIENVDEVWGGCNP